MTHTDTTLDRVPNDRPSSEVRNVYPQLVAQVVLDEVIM